MGWQHTTAKWMARLLNFILFVPVIQIMVFGGVGWEKMFDPPLESEREEALARIGVLFDHGFQASTWVLTLLCIELGDIVMLRCALGTVAFGMGLNGVYGLHAFYEPACSEFNMCPDESVVQVADGMAPAFVGIALLGLAISFFEKPSAPEDRPYTVMK